MGIPGTVDLSEEITATMNTLVAIFRSSFETMGSFIKHRGLLLALTRREIAARYRGSGLGLLWSLITPLTLLATYTLVFGYFFKMRWGAQDQPAYFVVMFFCGLIPFNCFVETVSRAPALILQSPNYVKRIAFPVQLLPAVVLGSSLFHALISTGLLFVLIYYVLGYIPLTALYLPLIWLPLTLFTLSAALFLAAAGVFIRDLSHGIGLLMNILFFLTPIIYPANFIPEAWRVILWINPVAVAVLQIRENCILGVPLQMRMWIYQMLGNILLLLLVAGWFKAVKRRFADVL